MSGINCILLHLRKKLTLSVFQKKIKVLKFEYSKVLSTLNTAKFFQNLHLPREFFWLQRLIFLHWITSLKRMSETLPNLIKLKNFGYLKKAGVVLNFCLIGKIYHNFLVLRMIESACKTFLSIQTLDLHKVKMLLMP